VAIMLMVDLRFLPYPSPPSPPP